MPSPNNNSIDLGPYSEVLKRIAIRAIMVAILSGTVVGLISLNRVTSILLPLVAIIPGWFLIIVSYRVSFNRGQEYGWLSGNLNHLILIAAILIGGIWSAVVQTSICFGFAVQKIPWLTRFPLECTSFENVNERVFTLSIAGILGFLIIPFIYFLGSLLRR